MDGRRKLPRADPTQERAEAVLAAVGLPEKVRGEELGLEQFLEIYRA